MRVVHLASGFLVSLSLLGSVMAHEFESGGLTIDHPSSRPTPPTAKAGYLSICNDGADADRLIGGSATVGGRFEIHESSVENGVAWMRRV